MGGRRPAFDWPADEAPLRQRHRREAEAGLPPARPGLRLLREGPSATEVAALVDVHRRSVQRWPRWYRQGGLAAVARHRQGVRQGRIRYLTPEHQAQVTAATAQSTIRTVGEAARWAEQQFGVRDTG